MSSIPLYPITTNLPSTNSFVNASSIPPRLARPDLEISFNEFVEGPSDFSQDAPSGHPSVETRRARSRTVTAAPRRSPRPPPTAAAPTQPLPSIPTSPEQDLDGSEDGVYRRLVGVFSPRVTQGLDTAGVSARQARKESDMAVGSTAPSSRSPEALRQPSSPPLSPPLSPLVSLTPILERIWPLFFNRWKPAITSPLTKPAAVPVAHDSSPLDSPQSYYPWSTPAIESLESPYLDPDIPFSPDSFINSSPPLKAYHTPLALQTPTVRFTADASPRISTATGNPSRPVSLKQQSPMSFASRATVSTSRTLRHTSDGPMRFSPGMGMEALEFGRVGKLIYRLYPIYVFFHILAQLFLDFNMVYILILVALNPTLPSSLPSEFFPRFYSFALSVPLVQTSTGFWITLGAYILLSLVWLAGVCVWRDLYRWLKDWDSGSGDIEAIYGVAASFNYTCLRSFGHFSLLFRVQLAAFCKRRRALCKLDGTVCVDGALESFHWNIQNWPTVLLSTPRAGISLFVLLRYGTTAYGAISDATGSRNSIYFASSGVLSNYGIAILITNCCYAAYRILILLASYLGLLILNVVEPRRERARATRRAASQHYPFNTDLKRLEEGSRSPCTLDGTTPLTSIQGWERRREERIGLAWGISTDLASIHSSQDILAHRNTSTEISCCTNDTPEHVTNTTESNRRSLRDKEAEGMEKRNDTPAEKSVTRGRPTKWRGIAPYIISPVSDNKDPTALDSSPAPFQPPMTVKFNSSPQFDYFNPNPESPRLSSGPTLSVSQSQFTLPGFNSSLQPSWQPSLQRSSSRDSKQLKSRFSNWSNGTNISLRLPTRGRSTSVLTSPSPFYLSSFQGSSFEFPLPSPPIAEEVLNCTALSIAECGLNISDSMPVFTDPFPARLNRSPSSKRISRPGPTWRTSNPLAPCPPVERRQSLLDEAQRLARDRQARQHNLVRDRNGRHSLPSGEINSPLESAGEVEVGRVRREDTKGVVDGDWFRAI